MTFTLHTMTARFINLFFALSLLVFSVETHAAIPIEDFDHFNTGFPLIGKHDFLDCSSCHVGSIFKGTPLECGLCHNGSLAPGKHPQHYPSSNRCDDCHTENTWTGAKYDHSDVREPCQNCHNNVLVVGKSPSHIASTQVCDDCHNTITFNKVGRVDHDAVLGSCKSCHNGVIATGKHSGHIRTTAECDLCHSTLTWRAARFDHATVAGQACQSCHNGSIATGKHAGHIQTNLDCGDCHSTTTWQGAKFDHSTATGACSSCHNGNIATGKPGNHFLTTRECLTCHLTTGWIPVNNSTYRHDSANYPGDHSNAVSCINCHTTNAESITWPFAAYQPDCAGCHANDYDLGAHNNTPVSTLKDCAGSCHFNGTQTGVHRPNAGAW